MAKVLIVEDDSVIAEGMARHLASAGFDPVVVGKGEQGLARLRFERPDVVVLDLMLPERDGWSVIQEARAEGIGTPIVVVSARGTEHDRVHALRSRRRRLSRQAVLDEGARRPCTRGLEAGESARRHSTRRADQHRELRIDPREVQAFVDDESAELTPTEFRLLYQLALERGRVVTRDELLQKIWGRARRTATAPSTFSSGAYATRSTGGRRGNLHPDPVRSWLQIGARGKERGMTRLGLVRAAFATASVALLVAGCGGSSSSNGSSNGGVLVGAGSTFVFPLMAKWIPDYSKKHGVTITYGPIGSGGGIEQVTNRTVDFGASDAPLSADQQKACKGCLQIPWALGGTSIPYHVKGAPKHLKLTGDLLAGIFLGKVKSWSNPRSRS